MILQLSGSRVILKSMKKILNGNKLKCFMPFGDFELFCESIDYLTKAYSFYSVTICTVNEPHYFKLIVLLQSSFLL